MEEATLLPSSSACEEIGGDESLAVGDEVKRQLRLAGQFIVRGLMQNLIQMISVMFVGHLAELPLAGASMASSFAAVTGFSLLKDLITESDCSSMVAVRHVVAPTDIMFPAGVHQGVMGDDWTESVLVAAMRQGVEDWRMKSTAAGAVRYCTHTTTSIRGEDDAGVSRVHVNSHVLAGLINSIISMHACVLIHASH
ncbi:uncharacterized protein LOC123412336 isoform X2 [Hordeum vulgare subsp. vulgare]|uniref:uncharacterized protein LOC123412336 isoform X2 n=1 Tax=Hordeum vulgare subsp. vulgare TaxID=112509 RepID=UPI001D1A33EE|nr:uncharacterized protein LOC123412336 isoform X2 [Hordeum vulgare subsp. vulgare]